MTTKLEDSNTASKTYWTMLSHLVYNKKIPAIPRLLVCGSFISDYCKKANLIYNFFASLCTPLKNKSVFSAHLDKTNTRISSFRVTNKNILSVIKSLDSSKSHGYENVSIFVSM